MNNQTHLHLSMTVNFIRNGNIMAAQESLKVLQRLAKQGIYNTVDLAYFDRVIAECDFITDTLLMGGLAAQADQMQSEKAAYKAVYAAVEKGMRQRV